MSVDVVIIDSGGANLASLGFALERLGARSQVSADPATIRAAPRVLLPGVGSAGDAMQRLRAAGLERVLPDLRQPLLGICLGMQLLYERSEEGDARGLGILPGVARRFPAHPERPVPHMGWNQLRARRPSPLLAGIRDGDHAYFVHSYALPVGPETVATADYGADFTAVVSHGNFHGTQFHPERSAQTGARILANFLDLS
jgi:glutamine amidotransferase